MAAVGASIARPQNFALLLNWTGEHCSPLRSLYRGFRREESCPLQGTLPLLQLCITANFPLKPPHFTQTLQNLYASLLVKYPLTKL